MRIAPVALLSAAVLLAGCSDAGRAKTFNYGKPGRVTCYTVGEPYFDDFSTGRIEKSPSGADGFFFVSASTGRLTEVTGECVVDYGAERPAGFKPVRLGAVQ